MRSKMKNKNGKLLLCIFMLLIMLVSASTMIVMDAIEKTENTEYIVYTTHALGKRWTGGSEELVGCEGRAPRMGCYLQIKE